MKIAITATHRVGKTSLAESLVEILPEYQIQPEPYYQLEESGILFSESPTITDFLLQLDYAIEQCHTDNQNIIFDRCPLDLLAYIHALDKTKNIQFLYNQVENALKQIEFLIFIPIESPDLIGCPASAYPILRKQVNDILEEWICDFDIEFIQVNGTIKNRIDQVLKRIKKVV
ncbi:AAA family ATPase [Sphingobacterium hungaricum]|uniref:NadR/Ttd14 AAA domain-containing protein n=1 Tax=Sphingobacterium hungaricum TaxID=2082723 RepID=A0A928V0Y9_9SPHI|nr:AAA family ATPase [Sphingobacterium hungaricum]MBE8715115.1 hypothetical protein [Sphingobacterium hungaricum]